MIVSFGRWSSGNGAECLDYFVPKLILHTESFKTEEEAVEAAGYMEDVLYNSETTLSSEIRIEKREQRGANLAAGCGRWQHVRYIE
jgi:hypothetical protein